MTLELLFNSDVAMICKKNYIDSEREHKITFVETILTSQMKRSLFFPSFELVRRREKKKKIAKKPE